MEKEPPIAECIDLSVDLEDRQDEDREEATLQEEEPPDEDLQLILEVEEEEDEVIDNLFDI